MRCGFAGLVVAVAIATPVARADTAAQPADDLADANDLIQRPLVLDAGAWRLRGNLELTLDIGRALRPFSVAPDAWYGVTPRLTVGVIDSLAAVDLIDAGGSLCFRGPPHTCDDIYRGSGLDVLWSWLDGPLAIAPRARFLIRDIDPWRPAVTFGGVVRWTHHRFAITSDLYLRLGLANQGLGNRATLVVPIWFAVQPAADWLLALHTGWDSELATWRDGWHIPIGLDASHRLTPELELGVELGFPHLLGPQNNIKIRSMSAFVEYRP